MFERRFSPILLEGKKSFEDAGVAVKSGRILRSVVTSGQGAPPPQTSHSSVPPLVPLALGPGRSAHRSGPQPEVRVPGPDSSTLPSTCPNPSEIAPPPSGPAAPAAPRPRAPPSLPCAALLCWAARAWTSKTSRQSPGTRPEPMAGGTGGRGRFRSPGRAEAGRAPGH